jgi:DNA replication protein DnaC
MISECASYHHTAAEDLLEIIMRRYERASTLLTSNRPVEDWGKLLGDVAAVTAMLDRLLHHDMYSSAALVAGGRKPPSPLLETSSDLW